MSLFGAKKQTPPLKELLGRAKENFEKRMAENASTPSKSASSGIGAQMIIARELQGGSDEEVASEPAWEEENVLEEGQQAAVTLTREDFNRGVRIHNAEVRAAGHLRQVIEPVWGTAQVIDEYGNMRSDAVHTISSDKASLSPPPTTSYGGSEISFPSQAPRERVMSPLPTRNYRKGSLLGLPPGALPKDPFSTPRASAGIIACKYIQVEKNASQHTEKEGGMEETRKVDTPILKKFKISDDSDHEDDTMTEVEWRDEEPYMTPTKTGKSAIRGRKLGGRQRLNDQSRICCRHQAEKSSSLIGPSLCSCWPVRMNWQIWESLLVSIL